MSKLLRLAILFLAISCTRVETPRGPFFEIEQREDGTLVRSISPFDGSVDSLLVREPMTRILCMSSTHVAAMAELDCLDYVAGVSGLSYVSAPLPDDVFELGYDQALDYEKILLSKPDVLLAYVTSPAEGEYFSRLRSLGIKVFPVHDHLEHDPLCRASYLRLFGALTGRMALADSLFDSLSRAYAILADSQRASPKPLKVLVNAPYGDAWYVPSKNSYMSRLISDAGGEVLGAGEGITSSILSDEQIYGLASEADVWINVSSFESKESLMQSCRQVSSLRPGVRVFAFESGKSGGLPFFESGAVRPDLVLQDLVSIFRSVLSCEEPEPLHFYKELR